MRFGKLSAVSAAALVTLGWADPSTASAEKRWTAESVQFVVDGSIDALGPNAFDAVVASVSAWQASNARLPTMMVARGLPLAIGYERGGPNQNTVSYFPDGHPLALGALAVTVSTTEVPSGRLLDADIVLNGVYRFGDATQTGKAVFDLQNTLTHEVGHALGLDENFDHAGATMFVSSGPREQKKRTLAEVDRGAIIERYGTLPGAPTAPDAATAVEYQCSVAPGASGPTWLLAFFGLGALGLCARRRVQRSRWAAVAVLGGAVVASLPAGASVGVPASDVYDTHSVEPLAVGWSEATVVGSKVRWEGPLLVTDLDIEPSGDGDNSAALRRISVYGGSDGKLAQVVAATSVPEIGERVSIPVGVRVAGPVVPLAIRFRTGPESQETSHD